MKRVSVGLYQPTPNGVNGAMQFGNSTTKTPYQRYTGTFTNEGGEVVRCILALNAGLVENLAVVPEKLAGKDIFVEDLDFQISLEKQTGKSDRPVLALTQFTIEEDDSIVNLKVQQRASIQLSREEKQNQDVADRKEKLRKMLLEGTVESRLDPRQVNRGVGTTAILNTAQPNTANPNSGQGPNTSSDSSGVIENDNAAGGGTVGMTEEEIGNAAAAGAGAGAGGQ